MNITLHKYTVWAKLSSVSPDLTFYYIINTKTKKVQSFWSSLEQAKSMCYLLNKADYTCSKN